MESINREKFGSFVAQLRKEKGLTQQELADGLYVSNKAVSKWERGQSLPDISLLSPLAELLGVTVAELLKGERLMGQSLDNREGDVLVGKVLQLSAQEGERRRRDRRFWRRAWAVCAAAVVLELLFLLSSSRLTAVELWDYLLLTEALTLGIGAYFCFLVKETLPAYYDENRICVYSDGIFRMNLGGVRINNSNWPHIIAMGRRWLLSLAVLWPPVFALARLVLPDMAMLALTLLFCLGFFIPTIYTAWKHQ